MRRIGQLIVPALFSAQLCFAQQTASVTGANSVLPEIQKELAWLTAVPSRAVGEKGHDEILARLRDTLRAIPGVQVWTNEFPVLMPKVHEASLTIDKGPLKGVHRLFPFWPAGVRLSTTPAGGINGRLIYVREGALEDLPVNSLRGQIAVMEITGGERWKTVFASGARAMLLLGSPDETFLDIQSHILPVPVNFPRFYVPPGPLADALRKATNDVPQGHLVCRAKWEETQALNIYALIKSSVPAEPSPASVIAVQSDAISIAHELAPGADAAVDMAVALTALRRMAASPPARPVLVAFLDACAISHLGARRMLLTLGAAPDLIADLRKKDIETSEDYREYAMMVRDLESQPNLMAALSAPACEPLQFFVKQEAQKDIVQFDSVLENLRLDEHAAPEPEKTAIRDRIQKLHNERNRLALLQRKMIEGGNLTAKDELSRATALWERARKRIHRQLADVESILQMDKRGDELRQSLCAALGLPAESPPVSFMLGLDLSDSGVFVGPSLRDEILEFTETENAADFCTWLRTLQAGGILQQIWPDNLQRIVNLAPLTGMDSAASHAVASTPNLTSAAASFGVPAMTWGVLDSARLRVDTPQDRPERLDWSRLGPQVDATLRLLDTWVKDPKFKGSGRSVMPIALRVRGDIVMQAPGEPIARLPMAGYICTLLPGEWTHSYILPAVPGVRRWEFTRTGADGRFVFDAFPSVCDSDSRWTVTVLMTQAYKLGNEGEIIGAIDAHKLDLTILPSFNRRNRMVKTLRAEVFDCREMSLTDLFDPRFLMPLQKMTLLDSLRGAPRRVNQYLYEDLFAGCLEDGIRWELLLRAGIAGNRMVLANVLPLEKSEGVPALKMLKGFTLDEGLPAHPSLVSARDYYNLDARRLADYRKVGVISQPLEKMLAETGNHLQMAERALTNDDGRAFFHHSMSALSQEVTVYQAVRQMADDVIRGVIFLLLLSLPFAVVMERLLFASAHVYRQLLGILGIFTVMAGTLWCFHPAFRMSSMPMMIIMAFGIIFMSLLVMSMIYSKFKTELERIRSGLAESIGAKTSRFGVIGPAIRLGIASMRKRKLRTALTGLTIVVITFTLLSFMSAATYVEKTEYTVDARSFAPAVLIHEPSDRPLPDRAADFVKSLAGEDCRVVRRYWWCHPGDPRWRVHVASPANGKQVSLVAAVGLDDDEPSVSGIAAVCSNWPAFRKHDGCYLSRRAATELDARPGDAVVVAGRSLTLLGTYDGNDFNARAQRVDGKSLLPPDYSQWSDEDRRKWNWNWHTDMLLEMAGGAMRGEENRLPPLSGDQVVILPAGMLKGIRHCALRNLTIPAGTVKHAEELALNLARRLSFPIYYGSPEGVRVITAKPLMPKAPKSLFIPLLIAGLIIFNTMLSSLAERKGDIYIYASLGLAPFHVGALFLAEAITYGLLGSIAGYIMGQGMAKLFGALGLMGGVTLNFGGTQAMLTMLMVLGVVFISSLVPAYMAGRIATPSREMRWHVPEPQLTAEGGHVILDKLPFTSTMKKSPGVISFLYDYFDAHRDGAIGHFTSTDITASRRASPAWPVMEVRATIWLSPYDLGVRQEVAITLESIPDAEEICEIRMRMTHASGQINNWHRMNRVFIGDLRRQMLGWQKLKSMDMLNFIARGEKMMAANIIS